MKVEKSLFDRDEFLDFCNKKTSQSSEKPLKSGCQHPSHKFEILWQVAQNSISLQLSYFVAQYVLIM